MATPQQKIKTTSCKSAREVFMILPQIGQVSNQLILVPTEHCRQRYVWHLKGKCGQRHSSMQSLEVATVLECSLDRSACLPIKVAEKTLSGRKTSRWQKNCLPIKVAGKHFGHLNQDIWGLWVAIVLTIHICIPFQLIFQYWWNFTDVARTAAISPILQDKYMWNCTNIFVGL